MAVSTSRSLFHTLSLLFVFLSLPSSLSLGGVHALGTAHPGGALLPRLTPHSPRGNPLFGVTKSVPGGKVVPGTTRRGTGLAIRAPTCQDDGYSICPSKVVCCPTDGLCCDSGDCCNNGYKCCAQGDCCPNTSNCVEIDGVKGCCPVGKTCSLDNNTCADEGYVPCKNESFCCKPGETCSRGGNGQAICEPPSSDAGSSQTFTTLTTFTSKSTRLVNAATSTTAQAASDSQANTDPSNTKSDQPADHSSHANSQAGVTPTTAATVNANALPTTMTNALRSSSASSASTTGSANSGSDFNPNPSSSGRSYDLHGSALIVGLATIAYFFF